MRLYILIFGFLFVNSFDCLASNGKDSTNCSIELILRMISSVPQEPGLRDDSIAKFTFQLISDTNCSISPEFVDALALIAVFERFASRQISGLFLNYIEKGGNMNYKITLGALFFISEFRGDLILENARSFQIDSMSLVNEGLSSVQHIYVFQEIMDKIDKSLLNNTDESIDVKFILINKLISQPSFKSKYKNILHNKF